MMLLADLNLSVEPAWPWSIPNVGMPAMIAVAGLLTWMTVWTYVGVRKATWRRVLTVLSLRLVALLLAFCMMLRPSFGTVHPEGVETSRLYVVVDASESMNVADGPGKVTRWQQVNDLWKSSRVQGRLDELAAEQKIEVVKYLAAEDVRPDMPEASAIGKRTDIGLWLHQLWQKHGHEKRLRGLVIFSDGGDNGAQFSATQEARNWRGLAAIHTFGVGNPDDARLRKDIALTSLSVVAPTPVSVKSTMKIRALAQAPGFKDTDVEVNVVLRKAGGNEPDIVLAERKKFRITREKDQEIFVTAPAPEQPGEYKLTMKVVPHPDEANQNNNAISTFVQVVKEKISVLWVDCPRVYEPQFAIRALRREKRFDVVFKNPPGEGGDPIQAYGLDKKDGHFDVIVVGDVSAQQFCAGKPAVFSKIKDLVENGGAGLLLLGGAEAFGNGGWGDHKAIVDLAPATFVKQEPSMTPIKMAPTKEEGVNYSFLKLIIDPKQLGEPWKSFFQPLTVPTPLGPLASGGVGLAKGAKGELVLAVGRRGKGQVALFAGDDTSQAWVRSPEAVPSYVRFWQQLAYWLAQREDSSNFLRIEMPRRRVATSEPLNFTFWLVGKSGRPIPNAKFKAEVVGPDRQRSPVAFQRNDQQQYSGSYPGSKEPGEYQLEISGTGQDADGSTVADVNKARFLVEFEDVEMARPAADHELLAKIAFASEGRFHLAEEQALLQYLDELKNQVNGESRLKTTHWPDWKRLPPSDGVRDQLAGLWQSFALGSFLLFVVLLGTEWSLRRWWGLV